MVLSTNQILARDLSESISTNNILTESLSKNSMIQEILTLRRSDFSEVHDNGKPY